MPVGLTYPVGPAPLVAIAEAAPETADHRHPSAVMSSVRLLARMTPDHRNGIPRQSDGSVGWSMPGASARVWPDGRIELYTAMSPLRDGPAPCQSGFPELG
ncbi:hypothetical protein [Streptomyces sp. NPDC007856]|uniref:hypothetical protein n=1 Tax=Streptomyces sp. NPDC007856 TaxID=3364781 RepID=UPI003675020F